jgi:hypothetical protein
MSSSSGKRRLAGAAEGSRLGAADLSQLPATAWARLAAAKVHLQELAMLLVDVRRDQLPQPLGRFAEHLPHGGV